MSNCLGSRALVELQRRIGDGQVILRVVRPSSAAAGRASRRVRPAVRRGMVPPTSDFRRVGRRTPLRMVSSIKVLHGAFDVSDVHPLLVQAPASPRFDPSEPFSGVLAAVAGGLASTPWLLGLVATIALARMVRFVRAVIHGRHRPDQQRRFSGRQRVEIFARAGHRCEQYSWLFGRCGATEDLQADHLHPHSRGGSTTVENGQALCRRHNKRKAARVPWSWEPNRLARRRVAYFPLGASGTVVRHRSTAGSVAGGRSTPSASISPATSSGRVVPSSSDGSWSEASPSTPPCTARQQSSDGRTR